MFNLFKKKEDLNYIMAMEQVKDLQVPEDQRANVEALVEIEKRWFDEVKGRGETCVSYQKELRNSYVREPDPNVFMIFRDGEYLGFQNFRGLHGMKRCAESRKPNGVYLVHRLGDKIDFDLEKKVGI